MALATAATIGIPLAFRAARKLFKKKGSGMSAGRILYGRRVKRLRRRGGYIAGRMSAGAMSAGRIRRRRRGRGVADVAKVIGAKAWKFAKSPTGKKLISKGVGAAAKLLKRKLGKKKPTPAPTVNNETTTRPPPVERDRDHGMTRGSGRRGGRLRRLNVRSNRRRIYIGRGVDMSVSKGPLP